MEGERAGGDTLVMKCIEKAIRAGAFRAAARRFPASRETFLAAADVNSAKVAALACQIAMAPTLPRRADRSSAR